MRPALFLFIVAGCRIGFGDQASPDAMHDAVVVDGHSICNGTCEVAHSMQDFSEQQGESGWYYGCWDISNDADGVYEPTDFQPMMVVDGVWRPIGWVDMPDPNFTWAYLAPWGGHPGSFPIQRADVRRWVSTVDGDAFARVTHKKADTGGGDGTRAMLFVDGQMLLTRDVAGDDGVGFVEDVPVTLHVGSTVELLLHFIGDDAVDTTTQELDIVSR